MAIQEARQDSGADRERFARVVASARPRDLRQRNAWRRSGIGSVDEERLARALGWFSIGLGLAQVAAPGGVARLIGVGDDDENRSLLRAVGLREIASGVGILTRPRPAGWVWARVGGDAMDLALLGAALTSDRARRDRVVAATAAVVGVTALDLLCGRQLSQRPEGMTGRAPRDRAIRVNKSVTINRPAEELYRFWRDFENLPRFMSHLESVRATADGRSHWKAKAPAGTTVEWDAEITDDRPNERIAWRSLEGADVDNAGVVRFESAPGGRGTVVRVEMRYDPPGGLIGATLARLFGEEPGRQVREDLRAFKQVMEVGEVTRSEASLGRIRHPARPPADDAGRR